MRRARLAVFDCDGTLVDSQASIVAAMHAAWDALGFERPSAEAVRRIVGLPLIDAIARLMPEAEDDVHARLREGYGEAWRTMRAAGTLDDSLFPGALEALAALEDAGWLLGIATGQSRRGLIPTLEKHGLGHRFVTLQTADTGPGKPHPDMLERAMGEAGAAPATTVMIGDTTFDILMARAAGTHAVGVAWGYHDAAELGTAGADAIVEGFGDLAGAAKRLTEGICS